MRCLTFAVAFGLALTCSDALATDYHVPAHFEGNRWVPAVTYHDATYRPSTPTGTPMAEPLPNRDIGRGSGGGLRHGQTDRYGRNRRGI